MYCIFDELPTSARVWIYQASRLLTISEQSTAAAYLQKATEQWAAHGSPLKSSFKIVQNRFVIIAADESFNVASGCSIDASTYWLKELGEHLRVDFFDRSLVYQREDESLQDANPFGVKKLIETGEIRPSTLLYTQQVVNIAALQNWPVLAESVVQYKRFFKKENADG